MIPTFELERTHTRHSETLVSYTRPLDLAAVDVLSFLRLAPDRMPRLFWQHGGEDAAYAGFGAAHIVTLGGADRFARAEAALTALFESTSVDSADAPDAARLKLFGGFAFLADFAPDGMWSAFAPGWFVVPRYLLTRAGDRLWLTVNRRDTSMRRAARNWACMAAQIAALPERAWDTGLRQVDTITYPLSHEQWHAQITDATERLRAGALDKVVLSRTVDVHFSERISPLEALERLSWHYSNAYRFLLEPQPGHAFFGATPELLARRTGTAFESAALAGSIRRGRDATEDAVLGQALLESAKDRAEHAYVAAALRALLAPLADGLTMPDAPTLYRLSNIQHLYTPATGRLRPGVSLLDVVSRLHPTPALGGTPQEAAVETIRQVEPVGRGWYAAPVGWIDRAGDGVFAVAIRSAVAAGTQARLYAGAGIVAASDPETEWAETALKFRPMLDALGVPNYVRAES